MIRKKILIVFIPLGNTTNPGRIFTIRETFNKNTAETFKEKGFMVMITDTYPWDFNKDDYEISLGLFNRVEIRKKG